MVVLPHKRKLAQGIRSVEVKLVLRPRHLTILDGWALDLQISRSEMARRIIDDRAASLAPPRSPA